MSALLFSTAVNPGVVYEIEVTDHEQSPPRSESIEAVVEGRNLKMGIASGDRGKQGEMIFHGDRREMVIVDHENQNYMVIDKALIERIAGQIGTAMSQLPKALENVPEERREMLELMMRERMPAAPPERPATTVRNTGDHENRNGYDVVRYEVLRDGRKIRDLWVTPWGNIEGGDEASEAFKELVAFFREIMAAIGDASGVPGSLDAIGDNFVAQIGDLDGFPVFTRDYDPKDGSVEGETNLRSARRRTLDPDAFEPPSGYERQSMLGGE